LNVPDQPALTTTSYAILGHLAMQPWTMYDLAAQMRRNVHFFFPRVESQVYAEPKRLVALGLAEAATEMTGKRARTVYSITEAGRVELSRWLASPIAKGPQLEFEGMLRVLLAPFGRDEDLRASLLQVRQEIEEFLATAARISDEYTEGCAPFQHWAQYRSMMYDFLYHFVTLIDEWSERSLERMEKWPDQTVDERRDAALRVFDRYRARVAPRKDQ
jgi:PadR family transcriptional regulator, regulatory protein AphA